jgi:hypothetical protein
MSLFLPFPNIAVTELWASGEADEEPQPEAYALTRHGAILPTLNTETEQRTRRKREDSNGKFGKICRRSIRGFFGESSGPNVAEG